MTSEPLENTPSHLQTDTTGPPFVATPTALSVSATAAWNRFRWIPALILAAAAMAKGTGSVAVLAGDGVLSHPVILFGVIAAEAAGAWLIVTADPRLAWLTTVCVFATLLPFALYAAATQQSCHCFGSALPIGPRVTTAIDVLMLCAAGALRTSVRQCGQPSAAKPSTRRRRLQQSAAAGLLALLTSIGWHQYRMGSDDITTLIPETLAGQSWPIDETFHPQLEKLNHGRWLVAFVRSDCEHCQRMVGKLFSDPRHHPPNCRTAVFLADGDVWKFQFDAITLIPEPDGTVDWKGAPPFLSSPAVFMVNDGQVVAGRDGEAADAFLLQHLEKQP